MWIKFFWRLCWHRGVEISHVASTDTVKGWPRYCWAVVKVLGSPWHHRSRERGGYLFIPGCRWSGLHGHCRGVASAAQWGWKSCPLNSTFSVATLVGELWCLLQPGGVEVLILHSVPSLLVWLGLQFFYVVPGWSYCLKVFCPLGSLAREQAFLGTFFVWVHWYFQYLVWGLWGNR